jgi:hypothetical protein
MFVFNGAPQALDENVVERSTPAVHADQDASSFQHGGELGSSELGALVGAENRRRSLRQCLLQRDPALGSDAAPTWCSFNPLAEGRSSFLSSMKRSPGPVKVTRNPLPMNSAV